MRAANIQGIQATRVRLTPGAPSTPVTTVVSRAATGTPHPPLPRLRRGKEIRSFREQLAWLQCRRPTSSLRQGYGLAS